MRSPERTLPGTPKREEEGKMCFLPRYFKLAAVVYGIRLILADRSFFTKDGDHPVEACVDLAMTAIVFATPGYLCGRIAERDAGKET